MSTSEAKKEVFDEYASSYDEALSRGISVSGEDKFYFARRRIEWLAKHLARRGARVGDILDFGCGTGSSVPYLCDLLNPSRIVGVDSSESSLEVARKDHSARGAFFHTPAQFRPRGSFDLAFCNGVFHHIPPNQRSGAIEYIHQALRPGGWFAFWENNPLNPGTRLVMSRIPFDKDAITLLPWEAAALLRRGRFEVNRVDFLFIFPRVLKLFRCLEPVVSRLPLGAQYQVLCSRK